MSATENNPSSSNYLTSNKFRFTLKRAPNINFFLTKCNLPAVSAGTAMQLTPFVDIPLPGQEFKYSPLEITFFVNEGMDNYLEIFNWMRAIAGSDNLEDYAPLKNQPGWSPYGLASEVVVHILNSSNVPQVEVTFHDAWPAGMTEVNFDSTLDTANYAQVGAAFMYRSFDFQILTTSK